MSKVKVVPDLENGEAILKMSLSTKEEEAFEIVFETLYKLLLLTPDTADLISKTTGERVGGEEFERALGIIGAFMDNKTFELRSKKRAY